MKYLSLFLIRVLPIIYLFYYDWKIGLPILMVIFSFEKDIYNLKIGSLEIINHLKK